MRGGITSNLPFPSSNSNYSAYDGFSMPWNLRGPWLETIAETQDSLQPSAHIPSKVGSQGCLVHGLMAACKWLEDDALSQDDSRFSQPWPNMS